MFDTAVQLLGSAGLVLQLVDRAGGRILVGPVHLPVLGLGLWAGGPVTTRLRVVGSQHDVEGFLADLRAQVERNRVASPH